MGYRELDSGINRDVNGAVTITGNGMDFRSLSGGSIHLAYGALTGAVHLEANNDPAGLPNDWVPVDVVEFEALAAVAGRQLIELSGMRSRYYRLVATITAGTGHIRAVVHGKGDG